MNLFFKKWMGVFYRFIFYRVRFWMKLEKYFWNCKGFRRLFWNCNCVLGCFEEVEDLLYGFVFNIVLYIKIVDCWIIRKWCY